MVSLDDMIERYGEDLMLMNGYEDCLAGVVMRFGQPPVACYDLQKVITKLMSQGMTEEEAYEWYEFNQVGAWVGDLTPCYLDRLVGQGGNNQVEERQ